MGAFKLEPTLIIQGIVAALTVVQAAAIPGLPAWAHAVIAAATIGLGAIVNRSQVTPAAKARALLAPAGPAPPRTPT